MKRASASSVLRPAIPPAVRRLAPSLLALVLAAEFFAYAGTGSVDRDRAARTLALSTQLRAEDAPLSAWLHELNATAPVVAAADQRSAAAGFLREVEAAVAATGVRIGRLTPRPGGAGLFDVELTADYSRMFRFIAALEGARGQVRGLELKIGAAAQGGSAELAASFLLAIPAHAEPVPAEPGQTEAPARDPFLAAPAAPRPRHVLTGITMLEEGRMATVDGRDYRVGDRLGDAMIAAIEEDGVMLETGGKAFRLGFATAR